MMAHANCLIEGSTITELRKQLHMQSAELTYWKEMAASLQRELENVPEALARFGKWHITIRSQTTYVIPDPAHHTPKEPTP